MIVDPPDQRRNGVLICDRGSSRSVCLFKDDFTELFQACHVPWSPPSHIRLAGRRLSSLCPCAVEDFHHYCFACSLLPPPSPTYAEIFKSKTPSKLKPIASLLCEKVMTYSNKFLPSYETKMKFLQGIIIQAVLTNLIFTCSFCSLVPPQIFQAHSLPHSLCYHWNRNVLHNSKI